MKKLTEIKALDELNRIKQAYQKFIKANYEPRAANCEICPTKGACCLDAHFVNVHITKLEAVAIRKTLEKLGAEKQSEVYQRAAATVEKYDLNSAGDTSAKTFACPLFETGIGCLVHFEGKPAPCISHACYENQADLPPDTLQDAIENKIERLNKKTYGKASAWLPLPVWLSLVSPFSEEE